MIDAANKIKLAVCLSNGTIVKGSLNIRKYNRLADYLNSPEADPFLTIYDAVMPGSTDKIVIVNRRHVVWATPEA